VHEEGNGVEAELDIQYIMGEWCLDRHQPHRLPSLPRLLSSSCLYPLCRSRGRHKD
jgi:hypothetical protein